MPDKIIVDMKARKVAQDFGLTVTGTIGFLLKAHQLGLIKSAYENVQKLRDMGFYVSEKLIDEIRKIELKKDIWFNYGTAFINFVLTYLISTL